MVKLGLCGDGGLVNGEGGLVNGGGGLVGRGHQSPS